MDDPFLSKNKSAVESSFNVLYLKEGSHIACLPIPNDLFRLIGMVAAHWGLFEVEFDGLAKAFYAGMNQSAPEDWDRLGFTRRKKLFVAIIKTVFSKTYPDIAKSYLLIMRDAGDLYWRRNTVVHGRYRVTLMPPGPNPSIFWAEAFHKRRPVRVDIDVPTLEKLWHGIAHLTGGIKATANLHGTATGWPPTCADTQLLQVYRDSNHPWHPNLDKRSDQPQVLPLKPLFASYENESQWQRRWEWLRGHTSWLLGFLRIRRGRGPVEGQNQPFD